jgi:Methyltransferase domain
MVNSFLRSILPLIDALLLPPLSVSAIVMKTFRRIGAGRLPLSKSLLMKLGVFPICDHYYEPMFHPRHLRHSLEDERDLPGIDWNEQGQLALLEQMNFSAEIQGRWDAQGTPMQFYIDNGGFEAGDAEYWYSAVRHFKPARIVEIGSGNSTLIARQAIERNYKDDSTYACEHICVEPYEAPWLEEMGVRVLRSRVEDVTASIFATLRKNDILFIDSSHVIRPQGDVLTEFLQILPRLASGVVVHVHDIFSPRDYSSAAIIKEVWFWNEQYLLEAFLTHNRDWRVIGALNYLKHHHYHSLKAMCPYLSKSREPGSFYMQRCVS